MLPGGLRLVREPGTDGGPDSIPADWVAYAVPTMLERTMNEKVRKRGAWGTAGVEEEWGWNCREQVQAVAGWT